MSLNSYSRVNWEDSPSTNTPINAANLNKMDAGIAAVTEEVKEIERDMSSVSVNEVNIANSAGTSGHIRFGITADGKYGYWKAGADSVTPFNTGGAQSISYSAFTYGNSNYTITCGVSYAADPEIDNYPAFVNPSTSGYRTQTITVKKAFSRTYQLSAFFYMGRGTTEAVDVYLNNSKVATVSVASVGLNKWVTTTFTLNAQANDVIKISPQAQYVHGMITPV